MNILHLFSWSYLTEVNPLSDFLFGYVLLGFFLFIIASKSLFIQLGPKNKYFIKTLKKKFLLSKILAGLGLFFVLSRFAEIPYFSQRLWLLIITVIVIFFYVRVLIRIFREYRKRMKSVSREEEKKTN